MSFQHSDMEKFIDILQNNISRMAQNSAQCKNWCLALTSALIVLSIDRSSCSKELIWLILLPSVMFWFLDAYYLQLETAFRDIYDSFIVDCKEADKDQVPDTTYQIKIKGSIRKSIIKMLTISVWPFYLPQILIISFFVFGGK